MVACNACGLRFTNPRPTEATIGQFYPDQYGPHQTCGIEPRQVRRARWWSYLPAFWRARCPQRRGIPLEREGRLLDFGCGGGAFLHRMHVQGWKVVGLDISQTMAARIRSQLGLTALAGTLPHPQLGPESFDYVTMWQSLEHVHRPLETLRQAHRLLVPGGGLLVSVPNVDSAPFRWFGPAWFGLELPRHLSHFSVQTLRKMIEKAGFEVETGRMVRSGGWLRASARLACKNGRGPLWARLLRTRAVSRPVAYYCTVTGQSDYILMTARKPHPPPGPAERIGT